MVTSPKAAAADYGRLLNLWLPRYPISCWALQRTDPSTFQMEEMILMVWSLQLRGPRSQILKALVLESAILSRCLYRVAVQCLCPQRSLALWLPFKLYRLRRIRPFQIWPMRSYQSSSTTHTSVLQQVLPEAPVALLRFQDKNKQSSLVRNQTWCRKRRGCCWCDRPRANEPEPPTLWLSMRSYRTTKSFQPQTFLLHNKSPPSL